MKIVHCEQVEAAPVQAEDAVNCRMCCLIGPNDAAPSFSMRLFEIAPRRPHAPSTPMPTSMKFTCWKGRAWRWKAIASTSSRAGTAVFVPPNQSHQFRNTGAGSLKFLCLIPHPLRGVREVCVAACGCDG